MMTGDPSISGFHPETKNAPQGGEGGEDRKR